MSKGTTDRIKLAKPPTNLQRKTHYLSSVIVKLVIVVGLLGIVAGFIVAGIKQILPDTEYYATDSGKINSCQEMWYDEEYGELKEYINLYRLQGENYEKYIEITDAYEAYHYCKTHDKAALAEYPGAVEKRDKYYNALVKIKNESADKRNIAIMEKWIKELDGQND